MDTISTLLIIGTKLAIIASAFLRRTHLLFMVRQLYHLFAQIFFTRRIFGLSPHVSTIVEGNGGVLAQPKKLPNYTPQMFYPMGSTWYLLVRAIVIHFR